MIGIAGPARDANAGSHDGRPKIVLHAIPYQAGACQLPVSDCSAAVTAGPISSAGAGASSIVYLLLERGFIPRPAEVRFGISYQQNCRDNIVDGVGIDILSWTSCMQTFLDLGEWPAPGSSLGFLTGCPPQPPSVVVLGWFYVSAYSADTLRVDAYHTSAIGGRIEPCNPGSGYNLFDSDFGSVVFSTGGQLAGCNPCVERCPEIATPVPPPECFPPPPPPDNVPSGDIFLHVAPVASQQPCQTAGLADCALADVSGLLSTPAGPFHHVYLMARRRSDAHLGLAGLQCGIRYDNGNPTGMLDGLGIDIYGWSLCADLQFPTSAAPAWPEPGSGNLITWASETRCQIGPVAVAGYFYVGAYGAGRLEITPRSIDAAAKLADCQSAEFALPATHLGWATFSDSGNEPGCNPCLTACESSDQPTTRVSTTWSAIKALTTGP
jgi:hypothetical protein